MHPRLFLPRLLLAALALATPAFAAASRPAAPATSTALAPVTPEALPPATPFDLQGFIDERLAAGERHIVLPPGRHLVTPRNREHLRLQGLRDVVIDAAGAELVCTETTRAITIHDCENLTLRGLVIDYDPLPFTQARIVAVSPDKTRLEVEVLPGYGEIVASRGSVEIFDPATNLLRGRTTYYDARAEPAGPGRGIILRTAGQAERAIERIGDIAVIRRPHAPGGEIPHAIMATDSRDLVFEDVTLYSGVTFGFFENGCDGSRYLRCRVDRRPPALDYAARGHPRLRSQNADAFHSKNARRGPRYESCTAFFMGDDAFAINGDFHFVTGSEGPALRVLAKHAMNLRVGDTAQLLAHDGRRLDNRKILAIERLSPANDADRRHVAAQSMHEGLRQRGLDTAYRVTLDAPVSLPPGSLICSADAIGDGFVVHDCDLGHNRSRGILVKAGRGRITHNRVVGAVMTGILVSPEFWWLEAGFADDLLVEHNTIREGGGPGISIVSIGGDGSLSPAGAFRGITVRHNTIADVPAPGLLLTSIRGLVEEHNQVSTNPAKTLHPWEIKAWGRDGLSDRILRNIE